jgi:uncharacterized protein YecT (DUF1311 family)
MKCRLFAAVLVAAASLSLTAGAARADCASSKNDFEDVYCAAKNFIDADNDLNAAYKVLVAKLDADEKARLKQSQMGWIKSRNEKCGKNDGDGYYVDLDCAVDTTRNRTQFLKDRTAECTAGSCDSKRLGDIE